MFQNKKHLNLYELEKDDKRLIFTVTFTFDFNGPSRKTEYRSDDVFSVLYWSVAVCIQRMNFSTMKTKCLGWYGSDLQLYENLRNADWYQTVNIPCMDT